MVRSCWKIATEKKKEILTPVAMPAANLKLLFILYLPVYIIIWHLIVPDTE